MDRSLSGSTCGRIVWMSLCIRMESFVVSTMRLGWTTGPGCGDRAGACGVGGVGRLRPSAAALAAAGLPVMVSIRRRFGTTPGRSGSGPRPTRSMPGHRPVPRGDYARGPGLARPGDPAPRRLVARRRQLLEMIRAERQREARMAVPHLRPSIAPLCSAGEELASSMGISTIPCAAPRWCATRKIARFRAWRWPGHCQDADGRNARTAAEPQAGRRHAGLAPFTRQSGKWRAAASLAEAASRCAPPCSWPRSSPHITTSS